MTWEVNVYVIGVQIYYTVYDRSTRVLYAVAVAVAVAEYAVWYTGLCCGIYNTMLCGIQDYAVWYTGLYKSISRTIWCGIQYYTIWYTILHYMVYNTSCYIM